MNGRIATINHAGKTRCHGSSTGGGALGARSDPRKNIMAMKWKELLLIYYYQRCHRHCSARRTRATFSTKGGKSDGSTGESRVGENIKVIVCASACLDWHVCAGELERAHWRNCCVCGFFYFFLFCQRTDNAQGLANFTAFDAHSRAAGRLRPRARRERDFF
jgi:hypothetical protein